MVGGNANGLWGSRVVASPEGESPEGGSPEGEDLWILFVTLT